MTSKLLKFLGIGMISLSLLFSGCKKHLEEYSEIKYENATVTYMKHSPKKDETGIGLALGSILGDPMSGLTFGVALSKNEEWNITFEGKIKFEINNKEIYSRFKLNDEANVSYKEKYDSIYDNKNGKRVLINRNILDNEFLDATVKF